MSDTKKDLEVILPDGTTRPLRTFLRPTAALMTAAFLLVISIFLPYWQMVLKAPQYPNGLRSVVYVNHLEGDTQEIDELNHYLGMPPLDDGGKLERAFSITSIACMALLLMAATLIHDKRAVLFALPALSYPFVFLADLQYILYKYGHSIDPTSALGGAIPPFTPPILGDGTVGQFGTESSFGPGFYLAVASALMVVVALFLHRAAWHPVVLAQRRVGPGAKAAVVVLLLACACLPARADVREVGAGKAFTTIQAALSAAREGDVVRVTAGTYPEHVTVDRTVVLEGVGGPVVDGGGRGTVVTVSGPRAVVRGLVIRNSGDEPDDDDAGVRVTAPGVVVEDNRLQEVLFGIYAGKTPDVVIRGNEISGKSKYDSARRGDGIRLWYCRKALVIGNHLHDTRDLVAWYCQDVVIRSNDIERDRYGVHFMYSNGAHVGNNRLRGNSVGIYTMYSNKVVIERNDIVGSRGPSGYGLGFKDVDDVTVRDNNLLDNRVGIFMDGAPLAIGAYCRITGNRLAWNDVGISMLPSVQHAEIERNDFVENAEQVSVLGSGSATENRFAGNFWSDYAGFDADGDGVGDLPYKSEELFENLSDRSPSMRLFQASLAQQAVDTAARLFPLVRPVPKLEDARPRIQADVTGVGATAPPGTTAVPAAALLAMLYGAMRRARRRPCGWQRPAPSPTVQPQRDEAALVRIEGLTKRFGERTAVAGVDLDVRQGEAIALWGSNGAGKTTVLRCALGLVRVQEGAIRIGGADVVTDGCAARAQIGYVPQELRFHDDLSVTETLSFYAALRGLPATATEGRLEAVNLAAHADKRVGELSGGMKQRLALALALLADPPLLLLDEPTSNLDLRGRQEFMAVLSALKREGKTMLFSAHHLEEVSPLADRVVLLENGTVVAQCTPAELRGRLGARLETAAYPRVTHLVKGAVPCASAR